MWPISLPPGWRPPRLLPQTDVQVHEEIDQLRIGWKSVVLCFVYTGAQLVEGFREALYRAIGAISVDLSFLALP